jgi:hypothetical protein
MDVLSHVLGIPKIGGGGGVAAPVIVPIVTITPTLGAELLTNGNMETGSPPTSWTAGNSATLAAAADERTGGAGAQSLQITNGAASAGEAYQDIEVTAGRWYTFQSFFKRVDSNAGWRVTNIDVLSSGAINTTTSWVQTLGTGRASASPARVTVRNTQTTLARISRHDDVSFRENDTASMFDAYDVGFVDGSASLDVVRVALTQAGVAHYADTDNFVLAHLNGADNIILLKVVGGTVSQLASVAATYVAGATLKLIRSGSTYAVDYNGTQLIAPTEIADVVFAACERWAAFNTWAGNALTNLVIAPL